MKPVIVLEFNELSPSLMDRLIEKGVLPHFGRLRDESKTFVTDAEERAPNLEPWIQWITVHTGLGFDEHGIFDLGDGHKLHAARLWDLVSSAGHQVWVCGSMNAGYRTGLRGYVIPDPWSTGFEPHPDREFDRYISYVRKNVQEHTRNKMPTSKADHLRFLLFMLSHGLSGKTLSKTIRQLLSERGGRYRWKRAILLDRLQWDVFKRYWRKNQPAYSTFFLNSTAHFQHMYWRNMDPGPFAVKPTAEEQAEYEGAVEFGYRAMDDLVGECLRLAGEKAVVILCSALSQQPCLVYESSGGKTFYRPWDADRLFEWAGIEGPCHYAPVMSEQFHLYFPTPELAAKAAARLRSLTLDGQEVMLAREEGKVVFAGCQIFTKVGGDGQMTCQANGATARFLEHFYNVSGVKSGMHHPDGIFWVRVPSERAERFADKIPLRQVAPTILSLLGIEPPAQIKLRSLPAFDRTPSR